MRQNCEANVVPSQLFQPNRGRKSERRYCVIQTSFIHFFFHPVGLFLLMGSGIHIVWGIFRVFDLYRCHEESSFYLCLVIWSWYIGAIIGSFIGGYTVAKVRKGRLYVGVHFKWLNSLYLFHSLDQFRYLSSS